MATRLSARCIRSGGWWAVEVREIDGLFTQARRLDQVQDMVKDAAALLTGRPAADFEVQVTPVLETPNDDIVQVAVERRNALIQAEMSAAAASRRAVTRLRADGMTVRDVATIMGISPQRVSQLLAS